MYNPQKNETIPPGIAINIIKISNTGRTTDSSKFESQIKKDIPPNEIGNPAITNDKPVLKRYLEYHWLSFSFI